MDSFQTLLHWGSMAWVVYTIYCLNDKKHLHRHEGQFLRKSLFMPSSCIMRPYLSVDAKSDVILFLELGESLSLLGTILTGLFGMVACCKGFGRILAFQDRKILVRINHGNTIFPPQYVLSVEKIDKF